MPPMTSTTVWLPRPLATPKLASSQAMGTMQARVTIATMPMGMSRSVRGIVAPPAVFRRRDAAMAEIEATPIVPAPTKRT